MPEMLFRFVWVTVLAGAALALLMFGADVMARLPGGSWLSELPVVLPLALVFLLLSTASVAHEKYKARVHAPDDGVPKT